jgi:uncharacterized membrane protein
MVLGLMISFTVHANQYNWQSVSFNYSSNWSILTNRIVNGTKMLHLSYKTTDGYPVSIILGFIPKNIKGAKNFSIKRGRSGNVIAANFSWPIIKRFSKQTSKNNLIVSFNKLMVANKLTDGALVLTPTPQDRIYISAQTFYLNKADYYIIGSVISRVDKGIMRRSNSYVARISSAYKLLNTIEIKTN